MDDPDDAREDPPDEPAPPGPGRPPPPSLRRIVGVAFLVLVFVLVAPALFVTARDITGSSLVAAMGLVPPAVGLLLLYRGLFRP